MRRPLKSTRPLDGLECKEENSDTPTEPSPTTPTDALHNALKQRPAAAHPIPIPNPYSLLISLGDLICSPTHLQEGFGSLDTEVIVLAESDGLPGPIFLVLQSRLCWDPFHRILEQLPHGYWLL